MAQDPAAKSSSAKPRPYWHVDAKWVSGLLSLAALTVTLLSLTLFRLTAEENAVPLAAAALEAVISPEGEEDADAVSELRQTIEESGQEVFYPFPGVDVGITVEELESQSAEQVRARLFTALAEEVYWTGMQAEGEQSSGDLWKDIGFMAILTHQTHLKLQSVVAASAGLSVLFLALLAFFSHRAGRLASPGCALLLAGLPGLLLFGGVRGGSQAAAPAAGGVDRISALLGSIAPAADTALRTYLWSTGAGLALLLAGASAAIWLHLRTSTGDTS